MPRDVRTHTRRTASGKRTTVRHHTRTGSAARQQKLRDKRGPNPGHARRLLKRSRAAGRRGYKAKAGALALLAGGEVLAWFSLGTTSFLLALLAGALAAISILLVK